MKYEIKVNYVESNFKLYFFIEKFKKEAENENYKRAKLKGKFSLFRPLLLLTQTFSDFFNTKVSDFKSSRKVYLLIFWQVKLKCEKK
jgi:hypothetical protein